MEKTKGVVKGGWHPPGKDGGKESWRGDYKGINQVAGWVGKGKSSSSESTAGKEHAARSLSSLKDPDTFGPPPKNVNFHGGPEGQHHGNRSDSSIQPKKAPPPLPHRTNTTTTKTETKNPPKLPQRAGTEIVSAAQNRNLQPKPNLPPRLPPRQNSLPASSPTDSPPSYTAATAPAQESLSGTGNLDQNPWGKLSKAGVSVPEFGIGSPSSNTNPWRDEPSSSTPSPSAKQLPSFLGDRSSRFASLKTTSPPLQSLPAASTPSTGGTTWAEKQAALKTASNLHDDPQAVTLSDAKATASTANNFRERHGDQVASGWKTGSALNEKYGVVDKVNAHSKNASSLGGPKGDSTPPTQSGTSGQMASRFGQMASGFKKVPPPPPSGVASPPPIPLSSKPR